MSRPLKVFVDTNILLEFQRLDHAGWSAVFANRPATFVLSAAVVREVDKAKGATKLRLQKRARSLLPWLRERLRDATPLANGAALEFYPPTPVSVLERGELHPTFPDDVILASAIHYSEQHADRDVVFVSEDTGALIRAEGFGLTCASPPGVVLPSGVLSRRAAPEIRAWTLRCCGTSRSRTTTKRCAGRSITRASRTAAECSASTT